MKYLQTPTGFKPHGLAQCGSGRLLVCLWNQKPREKSQGKVCKLFVNDTMQQICEYEYDKSTPLFKCPTYITENGNGDICVSDEGAVVVLNEVGMLRFRYKGLAEDPNFDPYGICTDSSRNIIIADMKNDKIHMIDETGGFVCYVRYENMEMPRALCVGQDNKLYVGEWKSGLIKVLSLT
ncbi:tripartite motif-containing protein 3-like [Saccostrea cucullata]|uniref:tripartite motif-containing protein 3-like n=1 Tax=Saccostrea cuccullata TaxID=36930 RepID=UPI002ED655CF